MDWMEWVWFRPSDWPSNNNCTLHKHSYGVGQQALSTQSRIPLHLSDSFLATRTSEESRVVIGFEHFDENETPF